MRVDFVHRAEDFIELSQVKYPASRLESLRREAQLTGLGRTVLIAGLFVVSLSCAALGWWHSSLWLLPLASALWFFVMIAQSWSSSKRAAAWQSFAEDPRNGEPSALEVDDAGVRYVGSLWTCCIEWCAIDRFFETPSLFLITDDAPKSLLIPKRAFATSLNQDEFRGLVRDRIAACPTPSSTPAKSSTPTGTFPPE